MLRKHKGLQFILFFFFCLACTKDDAHVIGCNGSLKIEILENFDAIPGAAIGKLVAQAAGGIQPYAYSIDGGDMDIGSSFSDLRPGSHTVMVKDNNNCTSEVTVSIVEQLSVSYGTNVAPVLQTSCNVATCHCSGNPYCFETYDQVSAAQVGIQARTSAGAMPPPASGITINPANVQAISNWIYQGALNN
ncbi:MAG: hypothetical protein ACI9QN_000372 [Arcticibacterium sp.]|jgi:hypothetical protein